jgi:hypothetical protein
MAPLQRVEALFAKQAINTPVIPFNCLNLIAGEGIELVNASAKLFHAYLATKSSTI